MSNEPFSPFQSPNAPQPGQPIQPGTAPASLRPTEVTVFGILNLVFAGFGLFGFCCATIPLVAMPLIQPLPNQPPNPVVELMQQNQAYYVFTIVSLVLGLVATGVLAFGGYGLLKMRPWGRQLSIVYGAYAIFAAIAGLIANWFWLYMPLMEQANQGGTPEQMGGAVGSMVGGLCGSCFGIIYPILLLIFMMRPNVVQACRDQTRVSVGHR